MRKLTRALDQFFVYHPSPWIERDWSRWSGLPLQDVWFQAEDGTRLFGWFLESSDTPAVLLWCHGNAGNIINRLDNLVELYRLGLSVFLFDYRGYGRSQGKPTEEGLYQDGRAAYEYLTRTRRIAPERLLVFGRSLGAAVATEVAACCRIAGVILESAFPSVEALARYYYFGLPAHWLLRARFNLLERLRQIKAPILIIHGDQDTIVPIQLGEQVFQAAPEPKSFYVVRGADHNNLYGVGGKLYFQRLRQFANEVIR